MEPNHKSMGKMKPTGFHFHLVIPAILMVLGPQLASWGVYYQIWWSLEVCSSCSGHNLLGRYYVICNLFFLQIHRKRARAK